MTQTRVSFIIQQKTLLYPPTKGKSADSPFLSTINTDDEQKPSEDICEIQMFIERQRAENAKKKTTYDLNVVKKYFVSIIIIII